MTRKRKRFLLYRQQSQIFYENIASFFEQSEIDEEKYDVIFKVISNWTTLLNRLWLINYFK